MYNQSEKKGFNQQGFSCCLLQVKKIILAFLVLFPLFVQAAEWRASSGLSVGETYTDNIGLNEGIKDSELVTIVTPNFRVNGTGARAKINVLSALEFNTSGGQSDSFNPQVRANASSELLKDFFFIEADASARQVAIDPFVATDNTNINQRGNSSTTYQYGFSPYISSRIGSVASYQLRYKYDEQVNKGESLDDSSRDSISFGLNSGTDFGRLSWGVSGNYRTTDFEDETGNISAVENSDNEFISATLHMGYKLNRKWQLTANTGKEWNDFVSLNNEDKDGENWAVGLAWTPTSRTNLKLDYGKRFFGSNPSISFTHRHKRSVFNLGYSRSVTDTRSIRQRNNVLIDMDSFGQAVDPFSGEVLNQSTDFTSANNSTIVDERLDFSYSIKGKRSTLTIKGDESKQKSQDTFIENKFSRYSLVVNRTLAANMSVNFSYTWDQREEGLTAEKSNTDFFSAGVTRSLSQKTSVALTFSLTERNSDRLNDDYRQNRISFFLTTTF